MSTSEQDLQLDKPNPARVYDYLIGGKLNYAIDREFAHRILEIVPLSAEICLLNRYWLRRVVRFAVEQGIRQFVDVGSGMPTEGHVHEVAQGIAPECRVVYVDNEPIAVAHSEIVLEDNDRAIMINADGLEPDEVMGHPETRRLLDLNEPVMVIMAAFLHFTSPEGERDEAVELLARYADHIAPGSYFAISLATSEASDPSYLDSIAAYKDTTRPIYARTHAQTRALLGGFELVDPGVTFTVAWRPDTLGSYADDPSKACLLAGVARKS
ncbi:SAM-dependent methyltransferase [Amycolatopsis pigmentata]|uniref:SAM-dependent methyltransferase n=1 Tax=Amycolatopsis pigmentata TaxID=450801 RepID=A0ABW5FWB5_9PSEU